MNLDRIRTLMGKELREFRASPAALAPVVLLIVVVHRAAVRGRRGRCRGGPASR